MKIDPSFKSANVECVADPLEIDEFPLDGIADALAADLRDAIAAQPGERWDRTGHLKRGTRRDGADVVVPGDRLQRDELRERFAAEVMSPAPADSKRVVEAADKAATEAITGSGKR